MVFKGYARYYDALYGDKDYPGECDYLERVFRAFSRRRVNKILDLGCGTGHHALLLAERGYKVLGVDVSPQMLALARERAGGRSAGVRFRRGDIRKIRLRESFDAVISMFAVMGYQTEDEDVRRALKTAARHLPAGGLFVFDVWFGPAVLQHPPGPRKKTVATAEGRLVRSTDCTLDLLRQVVEVRFRTELHRGKEVTERVEEIHPMRFFFPREIALLLDSAGLALRLLAPFMRLKGRPGRKAWNVTVVAEKVRTSRRGK
jgi:SAM-dependent methyltransferase